MSQSSQGARQAAEAWPAPQLDRELSHEAATAVGAVAKDCYANAFRALCRVPALDRWTYVEGVVIYHDTGVPVEHGWLESPEGDRLVDPTAVILSEAEVEYYPGDRYSRREVFNHLDRGKHFPLGWGGTLGMRRAWYNALAAHVEPTAENLATLARWTNQDTPAEAE